MDKATILSRLKSYLPDFYDGIVEFDALLDTESEEIKDLWNGIEGVLNEAFIDSLTIVGVAIWESILGITPSVVSTLEDRRNSIKVKLFVKNKAEFTFLKSISDTYVTTATFVFLASAVIIETTNESSPIELINKIRNVIPAHLLLKVSVLYNPTIGFEENIYKSDMQRLPRLGTTFRLGTTPFATVSEEVQVK